MHATKRLAKRSIVGSRVSAMWSDGIFYPGLIRGIETKDTGETFYQVHFDDGSFKVVSSSDIVGPGFRTVTTTHLKFNQRVYTTYNGREVGATVQKHRKQTNEVLLTTMDDSETNFKRKLDEVRLLERRKSARLVDNGTDYLKLADMCSEAKKRPVSTSIEVPSAKAPKVEEEPPMNDVMAAMVLTALSGSPLVYRQRNLSGDSNGPMSPASSTSSGCSNISPSPSPSTSGHFSWDIVSRSTPSPASSTSDMESSPHHPQTFDTAHGSIPSSMVFSSSVDEGIDVSSGSLPFRIEDSVPCSPTKKFKSSGKTSYKCTWQRCGKTLSTVQGIERHIRTIHLSRKDGEDYSDHEEEFYYTEIDTTVEAVSDTLANMFTSSPPPTHLNVEVSRLPHPHAEAEKPMEVSVASSAPTSRGIPTAECPDSNSTIAAAATATTTAGSLPNQSITMTAAPMSIPSQNQFTWRPVTTSSFSYHSPTQTTQFTNGAMKQKFNILHHHHRNAPHGTPSPASPHKLQSPIHTKIRSEGKKCRKVYGMDNRDMWCTQCRWKKACVRFT